MKLIFRTAFKNIMGSGVRTWLNASILSVVMVIMVGINGLMDGWHEKAVIDSVEWEYAYGQLWSPSYDPYDALKLPDAHEKMPQCLDELAGRGDVAPVLAVPGSLFPNGRMVNVVFKGLDAEQNIIKIPAPTEDADFMTKNGVIPVSIGKTMAQNLSLKVGDNIMARWRDKNGTFDARTLVVSVIFDTDNVNVDNGFVWMRLDNLQEITLMEGEASYFICGEKYNHAEMKDLAGESIKDWSFKDPDFLMSDLLMIVKSSMVETYIVFFILLSLALLTVFDTQTLSIFQRKKEIGTYVALGMTPGTVTAMFTIEGTMYSIISVLISCVWGTPLLWLFKIHGWDFPEESVSGMMVTDVMYPVFNLSTIISTILIIVVASAIISYFPARKIARMNMVLALKGKVE